MSDAVSLYLNDGFDKEGMAALIETNPDHEYTIDPLDEPSSKRQSIHKTPERFVSFANNPPPITGGLKRSSFALLDILPNWGPEDQALIAAIPSDYASSTPRQSPLLLEAPPDMEVEEPVIPPYRPVHNYYVNQETWNDIERLMSDHEFKNRKYGRHDGDNSNFGHYKRREAARQRRFEVLKARNPKLFERNMKELQKINFDLTRNPNLYKWFYDKKSPYGWKTKEYKPMGSHKYPYPFVNVNAERRAAKARSYEESRNLFLKHQREHKNLSKMFWQDLAFYKNPNTKRFKEIWGNWRPDTGQSTFRPGYRKHLFSAKYQTPKTGHIERIRSQYRKRL